MVRSPIRIFAVALAVLAPLATFAQTPQAPQKRTLSVEDFKLWENLVQPQMSPDGRWVSWQISRDNQDGKLVLRNSDSPTMWETPVGAGLQFSDDSKWAAYRIGVPRAEADRMREQKRPVLAKLGLRKLESGEETSFEAVRGYRFLKGSKTLLIHKASQRPGGDLVVWDLESGSGVSYGNVAAFLPNKAENLIAIQYDSDSGEKGVQILDVSTGSLKTLQSGKAAIRSISWADKADTLSFLVAQEDPKKEGDNHHIVSATYADGKWSKRIYDPGKDEKFPKGFRISEFGGLSMNRAGTALTFGIKQWDDKKAPDPTKPEDKPGVDIWHYKDVEPMPLQKSMGPGEKNRTWAAIWRPATNAFTQLGNEQFPDTEPIGEFDFAMITDPKPYRDPVRAGGLTYADYYIWNLSDNTRTKFLTKRQFGPVVSPDGTVALYWAQGAWQMIRTADLKTFNLTKTLKVRFEDDEYDGPQFEVPAARFPAFLDRGTPVIYDNHDAWLVNPESGTVKRLTEGGETRVRYQLRNVGWNLEGEMSAKDPLYFGSFDRDTKLSGIFRREPTGGGKTLIFDKAMFGVVAKAKNAERMIFTMESFDKSPNLYVTNTTISQAKPVSNTNPQQTEFYWPKNELVEYTTKSGWKLKGILTFPANYQPGRTYPMITTIYERLSDAMYNYEVPQEANPYNIQAWSQRGYFVFQPDITYRKDDPGRSAVECLNAAVDAVFKLKVGVDPDKIGLCGHSWGGYQTTFVYTQTKLFKVAVAGAPLTELTSMYNSFYWNWGESNQVIFESSQGRFTKPWWEEPDAYIKNSPLWNAQNIAGPFLMLFGDADGAVDWHQGIYYYNTLRRMGKPIIMVVYEGENHFPSRRPNQVDFTHRLNHFMDVYLQGAKPEAWVTDGVPFVKKG